MSEDGLNWGSYGSLYGKDWQTLAACANDPESLTRSVGDILEKSFTTGSGVVAADATGGQALRMQYLKNLLYQVSHDARDAATFNKIPKEKVWSTTFEWSQMVSYGGVGDGFVAETGSDGSFNGTTTDDSFARRIGTLKYMLAQREVSDVAAAVRNVLNPATAMERGAALEIAAKANQAIFWGDSKTASLQYDGLYRQILDWAIANTSQQAICYDANNAPLDEVLLNEVAGVCRQQFGDPSLLIQSIEGYGDTDKLLYPRERFDGGSAGASGVDRSKFLSRFGVIQRMYDPMLRVGRPTRLLGTGNDGHPLTAADTGAKTMSATPFNACAAGSASTTHFLACMSTNAAAASSTAPAVPSGDGNQHNHLAAGDYYYAISTVYQGKESLPWIHGHSAIGLTGAGSGTGITVTAGQVVTITVDPSVMADITAALAPQYKLRIYRCATDSTNRLSWDLLCEVGTPSHSATFKTYDNGMWKPNTDSAFLITESKGGVNGWMMAELLPLMRKTLPVTAMSARFAYLWFAAPFLLAPPHHIMIRNIGKGPRP